MVPEGYGPLTFQDGALTSLVTEPGGYIWNSDDLYSLTVVAGDSFPTSKVSQFWNRFKFGGRPGTHRRGRGTANIG